LSSKMRVWPLLGIVALLLGACSSSAPALPPDTTSVNSLQRLTLADFTPADAALTCEQIAAERAQIAAGLDAANADIQANRTRNQVAGYIGAAFIPLAYLATEGNYAEKDKVKALYGRNDTLVRLGGVKRCAEK
jgi:hypothetical protein